MSSGDRGSGEAVVVLCADQGARMVFVSRGIPGVRSMEIRLVGNEGRGTPLNARWLPRPAG